MGCDVDETSIEQKCGFGKGRVQTEYFACADIAIFKDKFSEVKEHIDAPELQSFSVSSQNTEVTNTSVPLRKRRFAHHTKNFQLPYFSLTHGGGGQREVSLNQVVQPNGAHVSWIEPTGLRLASRLRRRAHGSRTPVRKRVFSSRFSGSPPNGRNLINVRPGEFFTGNMPVPAMIQVQEPMVRRIFANEEGAAVSITSPVIRQTETSRVEMFMNPLIPSLPTKQVVRTVSRQIKSTQPIQVKQCNRCPFDKCLDEPFELDGLFPGLFQDPLKFLDCVKYDKLFNLKKYKLVSDGLPDCTHPRFKRQLMQMQAMPRERDDEIGCCAT